MSCNRSSLPKPHSLLNRKRRVKSAPREKENSPEDQELDEQLPQEVEGDTSVSQSVETNITDTKTLGNERCACVVYALFLQKVVQWLFE